MQARHFRVQLPRRLSLSLSFRQWVTSREKTRISLVGCGIMKPVEVRGRTSLAGMQSETWLGRKMFMPNTNVDCPCLEFGCCCSYARRKFVLRSRYESRIEREIRHG